MGIITFNNKTSYELGVRVETFPEYEIPERNYEIISVSGRNGDILIDSGTFKNVPRTYQISVPATDSFYQTVNSVAEWLHSANGYARLEDTYEPNYYRLAAYREPNMVRNLFNQAGQATISFDCKPQRFLKSGENSVTFDANGSITNPTQFSSLPLISIQIAKNRTGELQVGSYSFSIKKQNNVQRNIKGIAHRGKSSVAPENTIPAFELAAQDGFSYIETDVAYTSDGVPVCLHDSTIDRTSNGTGAIASMTLAEVKTYDFGSWKDSSYAGTTIPTWEECLDTCKQLGVGLYCDIKPNRGITETRLNSLIDLAEEKGVDISWFASDLTLINLLKAYRATARIGYAVSSVTQSQISTLLSLNMVNAFIMSSSWTDTSIELCRANNIPLEVFVLDTEQEILALDPYITGVLSNAISAEVVFAPDDDVESFEISIDCDLQDAYSGTTNKNSDIILNGGEFPKLDPGENQISFSGGITSVEITPRWWTI